MELPRSPSNPCCNSRISPKYPSPVERKHESPTTSRGASFPPHGSRGGILSLRGRERIPGIPLASQEEALSTGKARGTPGSCHLSQIPQMSQSIPGKPVFPTLPRLSSRASTHCLVARGTALCESLVGKPRGKATDPLIHAKGSVTAATAREESARACPHSRRGLTPLGRLQKYPTIHVTPERNPQVPAPTPHKVLGPGIDGRAIPRGPRATRMGTGLS